MLAALEKCLPYLIEKGLELYVEESISVQFQSLHDAREDGDSDKTVREVLEVGSSSSIKLTVGEQVVDLNIFNKDAPRSQGIDLVVAFGGDGLLMHCNTLFGGGSIPPSMCFDFGSLGFLAPFDYKDFELEVRRIFLNIICFLLCAFIVTFYTISMSNIA